MAFSSLTWVTAGAALLTLACAHQIDEWDSEQPVHADAEVSADGGAGSAGRGPSAPSGKGGATSSGGATQAQGGTTSSGGTTQSQGGTGSVLASGGSGAGGSGSFTASGGAGGSPVVEEEGGAGGLGAGSAGAAGSAEVGGGGAPTGSVCDALPAWKLGSYEAGDQVTDGTKIYACKPWPATDWCGLSELYYEPGTGTAWTDAWTLVGPC